jgi:hypothetical protein
MKKAILNVKEKTLTFNFKNELFVLDVSDIEDDHWDTITCKDNIQYDINFWFLDSKNCWRLDVYNLKTVEGTVEIDALDCIYEVEPIEYKDNFLCENLSSSQEVKKIKTEDKHNILFEKNTIVLKGIFAWMLYVDMAILLISFLIKFSIFIVTLLK